MICRRKSHWGRGEWCVLQLIRRQDSKEKAGAKIVVKGNITAKTVGGGGGGNR